MLSTRLLVGLSAWNVAGHTFASSVAIALVAASAIVGVLAMLSTRLPVGFCAWNVAGHTPAASVAASVATGVALVAGASAGVRGVTASVAALLIAGLPVGFSAWDVALYILSCGPCVAAAIACACTAEMQNSESITTHL